MPFVCFLALMGGIRLGGDGQQENGLQESSNYSLLKKITFYL